MEARHGPDPNSSQCEKTTQDDLRGRVAEKRRDGSAGAPSSAGRGWGNLAGKPTLRFRVSLFLSGCRNRSAVYHVCVELLICRTKRWPHTSRKNGRDVCAAREEGIIRINRRPESLSQPGDGDGFQRPRAAVEFTMSVGLTC